MSEAMSTPASFRGQVRRWIVKLLQATRLNAIASKWYYSYLHGFAPAGAGLDAGFEAIFEHAAKLGSLDGHADYCEFGLFKGYSFWKAQELARHHGMETRFFGFDSFEGLPEIQGIDQTEHGEFRTGQYSCSLDRVKTNLDKAGVDWDRTYLIKGFFEDTLTPDAAEKYGIRRIGVAMVDCDIYSSTVDVMRFLRGKLFDGSILIMDDWNCFDRDDNRGQRRAVREFLASEPTITLEPFVCYGANSQAFVIRIRG